MPIRSAENVLESASSSPSPNFGRLHYLGIEGLIETWGLILALDPEQGLGQVKSRSSSKRNPPGDFRSIQSILLEQFNTCPLGIDWS